MKNFLKEIIRPSPLSSLKKSFFARVQNRRGIAMVMAVATVAIMATIAMQVMYESNVEYTVNAQQINQLKAYYAAKSGVELSLLRIKIYQTIINKYGKNLGPFAAYVDQVWQFPFAWPMAIPEAATSMDKEANQEVTKESLLDVAFSTDIQDEGSKLDLSDLVSKSKTLQEAAKKRLLSIFKNKVENDDNWRNTHSNTNFEELINNIADWMSDKRMSLNGGDKKAGYEDLNKDKQEFPPNRGFRTIQEVRLVKGMTDEFFDLLLPHITIYGMRGINPNVASREVLKSIDPGIDDRVAEEIEKRRADPNLGGPFQTPQQFWDFVTGPPANAKLQTQNTKEIPIVVENLISFKVISEGVFANSKRQITVIVTDLDRTAAAIKKYIDEDTKKQQGGGAETKPSAPAGPTASNQTASTNNPLPKGPPRIVHWTER